MARDLLSNYKEVTEPKDLLAPTKSAGRDLLATKVSAGKDLLENFQPPSFMESVGKFFASSPRAAGAQGEAVRPHIKRYMKDVLSGYVGIAEGVGRSMQAFIPEPFVGKHIGKWVADKAKTAREFYQPPDPNFSDAVASGFGSMAGFMIPGFAVSKSVAAARLAPKLAGWLGASAAGVLEAMVEAGGTYSRAQEKEMSERDAVGAASKTFWLNLPTVVFTNKLGIFGDKGGAVLKGLKSAPIEAFQEWTQQVIGNMAVDDPTFEGALDSALIGAIVGGGTGGVVGAFEGRAYGTDKGEPGVPGTPTGLTIPPSKGEVFNVKQIDRNAKVSKSTADPSIPSPSTVPTLSPEVDAPKPQPLTGMGVNDFADNSLINKSDPSTTRIIDTINKRISSRMNTMHKLHQQGKNVYTLNPIVDTPIAFQQLEEKSGIPIYSQHYCTMMPARNMAVYKVTTLVNEYTEGLKKGYQSAESTERIVRSIVYKDVTKSLEERKIVGKLKKIFRESKNVVSYLRMRRYIDGAEAVPKRLEAMVMQGEKVFAEQGREGLEKWIRDKDFGVISNDRYFPAQMLYSFRTHISSDPFEVFTPYIRSREAEQQIYDYSMSLTQKLHSYLNRIYSDYYLYDALHDLKNDMNRVTLPYDTIKGIKRWATLMQGKGLDVGPVGQGLRKARGQFFKTVLGDPRKWLRNAFQPYYMQIQHYSLTQHAKKVAALKGFRLTPAEIDYFYTHVDQLAELRREQLYLYETFFTKGWLSKLDRAAMRVAEAYTKIDRHNRITSYTYSLARIDKSISDYKSGRISLHKFLTDNGISSFYDLEIKHILSLPPSQARLEVARLTTEKTQLRYKKVDRGMMALSEAGEIATSLVQYTKGIITRYIDGANMFAKGRTHQERWEGAQLLIGLLVFAAAADVVLDRVAGEIRYYDPDLHLEVKYKPYSLTNIIANFTFGGAQLSQVETISTFVKLVTNLATLEAKGDLSEKQRMSLIRECLKKADSLGEAYIPFLKKSLDLVEAFEGTRSHKLLTTYFDQKTRRLSALRRNKIERDWITKVQHTLFGGEKVED